MEGFYRQKEGQEGICKGKEKIISGQNVFFWEQGPTGVFVMQTTSSSFGGGMEKAPVTDYLIGADQKIPDWLTKITFWGKVKIAIKSGFIYFLNFYLFYLFIFGCIGSSLQCTGFSLRWLL